MFATRIELFMAVISPWLSINYYVKIIRSHEADHAQN